ncbi:polyprotein, partial [Kibale red colobus virus 1]
LLIASGGTGNTRSGLVILPDKAKIVDYHSRTVAFADIDLKIVDANELDRTNRLSIEPQPVVATTTDGKFVILRKHPPSLLDVLTKGLDAEWQPALHGPGNTGIDGYLWDFEEPASKEELFLTKQIVDACALRRGDAPACLPYRIEPVRGDPYRKGRVLVNTRFGDITTTTIVESNNPWLKTTAFNPSGVPVLGDDGVVCTTVPFGLELYIPTIPTTVLDYLDERPDTPVYLTKHGTEKAALEDLAKFDLSTQGFILPEVYNIVRAYLIKVIGYSPPIHTPATVPSNDSHAGINGMRFSTRLLQSIPNINSICEQAVNEVWQSVTPVTLKKQYCSKPKTRTILGTNGLISLGLRALLSGVTARFQLAGKDSPICLGKSKFQRSDIRITTRCLETDLASCDRSTPALVRFFSTRLLFELACAERAIPLYVANCCHDLLVTQTSAVTKRGGLSSGDPITSIANTIYSLLLYTQHMVLSAFKIGHPIALAFMQRRLTMEDLIKVQRFVVYSDDLVLVNEPEDFPNFMYWSDHLDLALGFKTCRSKTVITTNPGFLGCRFVDGWLVPQRERVLAALAYHMSAKDVQQYYINAVAILSDASAMSVFDADWFGELVLGIANCAKTDGFTFPGVPYFLDFFTRVSGFKPESAHVCGICASTASTSSRCGLYLCNLCAHRHQHCPVASPFCAHDVGSKNCDGCSLDVLPGNTELDKLLLDSPYTGPVMTEVTVINGYTNAEPGRYVWQHKPIMLRRDRDGCAIALPDGTYAMKKLPSTCSGINLVAAKRNAYASTFVNGPPGSGKTTHIASQLTDGDVVYCPTHESLKAYSLLLPRCRFVVPRAANPAEYGTPSDSGPTLTLVAAGYVPGSRHFIDEACYANPLDTLRILSKTPVTAIGDPHQLSPVKYTSCLFLFKYMKEQYLETVHRFSQNIADAIQPYYKQKLVSSRPGVTQVIYQTKFEPRGLVLTPYHRDRHGNAITIDSSQGLTQDIATIYLPSPHSINRERAIVAITRARARLYIFDPHKQLEEFFNLPATDLPGTSPHAYVSGDQVKVRLPEGVDVLASSVPGLACTAKPRDARDAAILRESPLILDMLEGATVSPLPRVATNLGFFYSPDLPKFFPIPKDLCVHWPVVTAINNPQWPHRLVVSLTRIHPKSSPATCAGYYVGESLFIGVPQVVSYYLTLYENNQVKDLPPSLYSTGRFEAGLRDYLDLKERRFAEEHAHAFIGDVKGTVVGGCHHITSRFLPPEIAPGAVTRVGVSSVGKAAKSLCTVTDIYLPYLQPYTAPVTASKVYLVNVDQRASRLMVWRDKTMYFQESSSHDAIVDASRFVSLSNKAIVAVDPVLLPRHINRAITTNLTERSDVAFTPFDANCELLVTTTPPDCIDPKFKLLSCIKVFTDTIFGQVSDYVYYYSERSPCALSGVVYHDSRETACRVRKRAVDCFHFSSPPCLCNWALVIFGDRFCGCSS